MLDFIHSNIPALIIAHTSYTSTITENQPKGLL